jgi:hypothetical protein
MARAAIAMRPKITMTAGRRRIGTLLKKGPLGHKTNTLHHITLSLPG